MASEPVPTSLKVAFILCSTWATLMVLLSLAAAVPAIANGRGVPVVATSVLLSVASAVSAYGLLRLKLPWLVVGTSAAWLLYLFLVPLRVGAAGIVVNVVIAGAVIWEVRRFR